MRLKEKTAFITGANRGIGKAILERMANEGANVYAHARHKTQEFEEFLEYAAATYGVTVQPVYFELTDTDEMKDSMKQILKNTLSIDILVNNAGIMHGGLFPMTKVQTIREVFEVNLFSGMELTQMILRKMMRQRSGSIINMSSIAAFRSRPGNSAYGVSKAAIKAWTETLAVEMAAYGIRVNAIAPGGTDTEMTEQMHEKAKIEVLASSAMGRLATTQEIANVAVFLASEEASFVNGQTLIVNGGSI